MGRQLITLGVVERAMEPDRRTGDERREEPPKEKSSSSLVTLIMLLLGLVIAASTWNFTELRADYQGFKADEIGRHERDATLHTEFAGRLGALEKAEAERSKQGAILRALARRQGIKVED